MGRVEVRTAGRPLDRGAAAVEFALLLPVILLVIFGVIDFGRMLNAQISVNEAAREGARATALVDATQGNARIDEISQDVGTFGRTIQACPASPQPGSNATVDVTYDFSFITPIGVIANLATGPGGTIVIKGHGVMPCIH